MEPVRSVEHRQNRHPTTGLVLVGTSLRNHRIHGVPVTLPARDRVLTRPTSHNHSGVPTALEDQITRFEATSIGQQTDRFSRSEPIQVRTFSTDLPVLHTHLQRVASGLPVYRSGWPVLSLAKVGWSQLLAISPNPNAPRYGGAIDRALVPDEAARLEAYLRPLVEEGRTGRIRHANAYVTPTRAEPERTTPISNSVATTSIRPVSDILTYASS